MSSASPFSDSNSPMSLRRFVLAFLVAALLPSLCFAQTEVSGHVNDGTTWTKSNSPYLVTGDIHVDKDSTLSIEAGVVVKFQYDDSDWNKQQLFVKGTLDLQGTDSEPVVFTSSRDDSYAGDTNGDGNETTPSPGDWGYIKFVSQANTTNTFEHAVVRYGGHQDDGEKYQIWVTSPDPTYEDVTIRYNTIEKVEQTAIYVSGSASPTIAYNNLIGFAENTVDLGSEHDLEADFPD